MAWINTRCVNISLQVINLNLCFRNRRKYTHYKPFRVYRKIVVHLYYSVVLFNGVTCSNPFDAAECNIEYSFCLTTLCTTLLMSVALD